MDKIDKDPILITGIPRSGTSMVAGIINKCGAFGGSIKTQPLSGRKGQFAMFENTKIREGLMKPYLKQLGVDPKGQHPLPDINKVKDYRPHDWADSVKNIMIEQGYQGGPYFYKGCKMVLTWPLWADAFPRAKWIIVRRKSTDIVDSCYKTAFMNAFNNDEGWLWWIRQHEKRFSEMYEAGLNLHVVWPERMIRGDYEEIYEMIDWLRLKWKAQDVMNFIEPKFWKQKKKEQII